MALVPSIMRVGFRDDAGRISEVRYRLTTDYDTTTPNFPAVASQAATVETLLDALTMDHIENYSIEIQLGGGGAAPNDAATNGNYAFIRTNIPALPGESSYVTIPAWDTVLYEEAPNGILDAAFNVAANLLLAQLVDVETGEDMDLEYSQARTRKVHKRNLG